MAELISKRMILSGCVALACLALQSEATADDFRYLDQKIAEIKFTGIPVEELLTKIGDMARKSGAEALGFKGIHTALDEESLKKSITLNLKDIPLETALEYIAGYSFSQLSYLDGFFILSNKKDFKTCKIRLTEKTKAALSLGAVISAGDIRKSLRKLKIRIPDDAAISFSPDGKLALVTMKKVESNALNGLLLLVERGLDLRASEGRAQSER